MSVPPVRAVVHPSTQLQNLCIPSVLSGIPPFFWDPPIFLQLLRSVLLFFWDPLFLRSPHFLFWDPPFFVGSPFLILGSPFFWDPPF